MPDIRVEIAPDAAPDDDPRFWTWMDVSSYRRQSADVEIEYGRGDEAAEVEAGEAQCTFDLRDGLLSRRNPTSSLYGRIGPNTPIRFRMPIASDDFSRTVVSGWGTSTSGHTWAAGGPFSVSSGAGKMALAAANTAGESYLTDAASLDVDVYYSASLSAVTTGSPWVSALIIRRVDSENQYRVHTEFKPSGVVTIKLVRRQDGANTDVVEDLTTSATYTAGTKVWTRVLAEGGLLRAKVWSGTKANEPSSWNFWSTLVVVEGSGVGFFQWRLAGNTNVGTLTVSVDDFTVDTLLWSGNVPEWPPRWDHSGNDSHMTLVAAGPMRRLGQGEDPVMSPLRRQLPRYLPAGYWPLEEEAGATSAGSAVTGGKRGYVSAVTFGDADAPAGATRSAKLAGTGTINFKGEVTGDTTGSFAALFFIKLTAIPAASTDLLELRTRSGTIRRWVIRLTPTGFQFSVYDNDDGVIVSTPSLGFGVDVTKWMAVQLETNVSGSNTTAALVWNQVGLTSFFTSGVQNLTGYVATKIRDVFIRSSPGIVDSQYSHLWLGTVDLPFVDAEFLSVSSAYANELASDRIRRICAEEGVAVSVLPGDSEPLGAQPTGRFLDLLRDAADADRGLLFERGTSLAYLPRSARYNVPIRMQPDWAGGDLAAAPQPTDDDQRLRTTWTVRRVNGSEATYENAAAVAKSGRVRDSDDINIASDNRLQHYAAWFTHLTTFDEMRWPTIELDLIAHPELIPQFLACRIGSRIKVNNPKAQVKGVVIDLIIEHIKQTVGRHTWRVTLTCSPARPWDVAVWGPTTTPKSRWGSTSTTLNAFRAAATTSWVISTASQKDIWSTTASGYQWDVAGELVTVQSVGAATGTGPYLQTVTVLRAQNGVSKDQAAGTSIRMAQPARWAL
jgi:hypothetical protein